MSPASSGGSAVVPASRMMIPRITRPSVTYGSAMAGLRKMLGIGKLPDDMRSEVTQEGVLFLAEFVPVTYRFSGSIPGRKSAQGEVRSYIGSLVITQERVLGTLSTVPKKAGRAIDQAWSARQLGSVTAQLSHRGLYIDIDISRVDPSFTGTLSLEYKTEIGDDVLSQLPTRVMQFDVPREYVLKALGIPA